MAPPSRIDPFTPLDTAEAILIDGANGVSGAPRKGFPQAGVSGGLWVACALLAALFARRRPRLVLGLLGLAALPGLFGVLVLRADAPARRPALAHAVEASLEAIEAQAGWPDASVSVVREDDDVLFPLGRFALPSRPLAPRPVVELELRGSRLGVGCRPDEVSGHVVCGDGP